MLYAGTNDLVINEANEEINKHFVKTATTLKTESNPLTILNIVSCGDSNMKKVEAVNKLLVDTCIQNEIPLIDHGDKRRLHF